MTRVQTWNSPGSTRVIVTLNDTIKYESARIASPDRIYFNLYKAKVGAKLSRQELDVDDGLLESVRVAQNKPDVVRLVLNVNGDKDYSAFLLANPYRLVIDIHSRAVNTAKSHLHPLPLSGRVNGSGVKHCGVKRSGVQCRCSTGIASTPFRRQPLRRSRWRHRPSLPISACS